MTGGQMAPPPSSTRMTTSPWTQRRSDGYPVGSARCARCRHGLHRALHRELAGNIVKTKRAIKKAFQYQLDGRGFSLIEILSPCPTNWKMSPIDACRWIDNVMSKQYPIGVIKDAPAEAAGKEGAGHDR